MKKLIYLLFFISTLAVSAQQKNSVETRALMQEYSRAKSATAMSKSLLNMYGIRNDQHGITVGVMAKVAPDFDAKSLEATGIKVTSRMADIVALRVPIARLEVLDGRQDIVQYSVCHKATPDCDKARMDTHVDSIQDGLQLPRSFKGDDVLIGICDWGFDYRHPNINSSQERRILRAWDQFKKSGPAPEGFDYGTEFKTYDELIAAIGDTSNIYDYNSHGTHVAGICGGRGTKAEGNSASKYIGMAPHAKFLLGSWLLDEASWMDEALWMYRVAKEEGKRLVINNSWGMYSFSTLDGTSLLSQLINHLADSGVVIVTSAGNNGDAAYHLRMDFERDTNGNNDTIRSMASYFSGGDGQMLIYWGTPGQPFKAGFALSDNQKNVYPGEFFASTDNIDYYENYLVVNGDTVHYNVMTEAVNPFNQRPHILLKVDKCSGLNLHMMCTADSGSTVHVWNVNYVTEHESNVGADFVMGGFNTYKQGDRYYGVGEPACAEKSIAVAAHTAGRYRSDSTWVPGAIAYFSSYGPTLDGRKKPEISAPGVGVISSINSRDESEHNPVAAISSNGTVYRYAAMSGTSMSGPVVSGIVALMLEANPNISVDKVRDIIFRTAVNDQETGNLIANDSISPRWGHGKINAMACVNAALDQLSIEEALERDIQLLVYPNPATTQITIQTNTNLPCQISVYSIDGRKVAQTTAYAEASMDVTKWGKGVFVIQCNDRTGIRTAKVVVR